MTRVTALRATVLAAATLCLMPSSASAIDPFDPDVQAETLLDRVSLTSGRVEGAGDVNGDGKADVVVQDVDLNEDDEGTAAYVFFGPLPEGEPTLAQLLARGFRVQDPPDFFNRRPEVEGIGDVNGDGRDDVLVEGSENRAVVVFGSASTAPVNVDALGTRGFVVQGAGGLRDATTGLGDVNGDGKDDFAVPMTGGATVVFGKATTTPVDAAAPGAGGYRIVGGGFAFEHGLGGGMDFNGDGRPDLVLDDDGTRAWVVYGKPTTSTVDLAAPGAAALTITAPSGMWFSGSASEAGDVNGDGFGDVVLGMSHRAIVVYGRASNAPVNAGSLGTGGFFLRNGTSPVYVAVVESAGDLNLDGYDDLALTASQSTGEQAYVVYGKPGTTAVSFLALGVRGYKVIRRTRIEGIGNVVADERPDIGGAGFAMSPPRDDVNGDCTIRGTTAANVINGTAGPDVICGLAGNDTINGLGGNDVIVGGDGDDRVSGGDGDDRLVGGLGVDTLKGDAGVDRISGGTGNDPLDGGLGDDFISGGEGSDILRGGGDRDRLLGFDGVDRLYGDAGDDHLDGERGGDTLDGGADADFATGGGETDTVLGGLGNDRLLGDLESESGIGAARDTLRGGDGMDDISGDPGNDLLYGDAGNDTLNGFDGVDSLRGGIGDDHLTGGSGAGDTLNGEAGNDTLDSSGNGGKDSNLCGAGLDAVTFDLGVDAVSADCETRTGV